jgi:hypothetical protein
MKKFVLPLLILIICLSSCQKEEFCGVKHPLRLPWLKEIIKSLDKQWDIDIYQCTYYDGIEGFLIEPCNNCYGYMVSLHSCDGTVLCSSYSEPYTYPTDFNVNNKKLIWSNYKH